MKVDYMFKKSSEKVNLVRKLLFALISLYGIIKTVYDGVQVIRAYTFEYLSTDQKAKVYISIVITVAVYIFAAWVTGVIVCAFGELCENASYISRNMVTKEREQRAQSIPPVQSTLVKGSTWRCLECGESNPSSSRICKSCGYNRYFFSCYLRITHSYS